MAAITIFNGVNMDRLNAALSAFRRDPSLARFRFRVRNEWQGGAHSLSTTAGLPCEGAEDTERIRPFVVPADEPQALLGSGAAPSPAELLLASLAASLTSSYVYAAALAGVLIEGLWMEVEGDIDSRLVLGFAAGGGLRNIRVRYCVAADAPRRQLATLAEAAQGMSPILYSLRHPARVSISQTRRSQEVLQ